jgi:hypothetical protein
VISDIDSKALRCKPRRNASLLSRIEAWMERATSEGMPEDAEGQVGAIVCYVRAVLSAESALSFVEAQGTRDSEI